jgi:RNA polymerase sigma factor (TIGR02999 family)
MPSGLTPVKREPIDEMPSLLERRAAGDPIADARLWSIVYAELHRLARRAVARERPSPDLQVSGVAHEAYLRIFRTGFPEWKGRRYFTAKLARAIEQYLMDRARTRKRVKRGDGVRPLSLGVVPGELASYERATAPDTTELIDALRALEVIAPRAAEVTRMRFILDLSTEETADMLEISPATVKREWSFARAFLLRELKRAESSHEDAETRED